MIVSGIIVNPGKTKADNATNTTTKKKTTICQFCETDYHTGNELYRHNRTKYACITRERCAELFSDLKIANKKLKHSEMMVLKQAEEIRLKDAEISQQDELIKLLKNGPGDSKL